MVLEAGDVQLTNGRTSGYFPDSVNFVSKLLAIICGLSLVLSSATAWPFSSANEVACADCYQDHTGTTDTHHDEEGGCGCACHAALSLALVSLPSLGDGSSAQIIERMAASDLLAEDGPVFGIEYPPQNA